MNLLDTFKRVVLRQASPEQQLLAWFTQSVTKAMEATGRGYRRPSMKNGHRLSHAVRPAGSKFARAVARKRLGKSHVGLNPDGRKAR